MTSVTTLGALANAGVLAIGDGYRTKGSEYDDEGIPILRVADVLDGKVAPSFKDRVSFERLSQIGPKQSRAGDVIVTTKGTVGRVALIPESLPSHVYSPQLCYLRVEDSSQVDHRWLYSWARSPQFQRQTGSVKDQTDMAPYVSLGDLRRFRLQLPPLDEQRRIAEVLGALDDLIDTNERVAERMTTLVQTLALRGSDQLVCLSELAEVADTRTVVPRGPADHYSLPAFDNGKMPERVDGADIKSNKTLIEYEVVLVSRLNPHIPRVWAVYPDPAVMSVASTEFVPMRGLDVAVEEVLAVVSSDLFLAQLSSRVTGTTGSHQRVDKNALFKLQVPDVRQLSVHDRSAIIELVREANASREVAADLRSTRDELLPLLVSGALRVRPGGAAA